MSAHISQSLEKLLFDHETVILPGFGGFVTTKTPATVDYAQGALLPPSRAITFNENLTVNDGLLVQRLCQDYGLNAEQASSEVGDFVEKTRNALDQREIINLPGVGRLYKNYAQKVQFLPDNTNFNTDSYGLPPLQFSPIMRSREAKEQVVAANVGADASAIPAPAATPSTTLLEEPIAQPASFEKPAQPAPVWEPEPQSGFFQKWLPWMVGLLAVALAIGVWWVQKNKPAAPVASKAVKTEQPVTDLTIGGGEVLPEVPTKAAPPTAEKTDETDKPESRKNDDDADEVAAYKAQKQSAATAAKAEKPAAAPAKAAPPATDAFKGEGRRAVIVVGTWEDKKAAEKMLALLEKNGWDTYFRKESGWQVGIETTYKDLSELKEHLKNLEVLTKQDNIWIKKK